MTETNMILSNPYRGERRAGFVGLPLLGVQVRTVPEDNAEAIHESGALTPAPHVRCGLPTSLLLTDTPQSEAAEKTQVLETV